MIVKQLTQCGQLFVIVFFKNFIVNLFSTFIVVLWVMKDFNFWRLFANMITDQLSVYAIVCGNIKNLTISAFVTAHMIKYIVQNFVCNNKLNLFSCKTTKKFTIVKQMTSVSCGGFTPFASILYF